MQDNKKNNTFIIIGIITLSFCLIVSGYLVYKSISINENSNEVLTDKEDNKLDNLDE